MSAFLRSTCVALCLVIAWGVTVHAQKPGELPVEEGQAQPPAATPLSSSASAVLRVVCPPQLGLSNPALIEGLIQDGRGITGAKEEFDRKHGKDAWKKALQSGEFYEIHLETERFENLPPGVFMADISVDSWDKRLSASDLLEDVRAGLAYDLASLDRNPQDEARRLQMLEHESKALNERTLRESKEIEELERALGLNISKNVIEQSTLRIDAESNQTAARGASLTTQRNLLQKRIAELGPKIAETAKKDPIVTELERVVELRTTTVALTKTMHKNAQVGQAQVVEAEERLAQARAELAKQVRAATQEAGGLRVAELQERLEDIEGDLRQNEESQKFLQDKLNSLRAAGPSSAELEQRKANLEVYRKAAIKISGEAIEARLQRQLYVYPTVVLLMRKSSESEK